jgi:hypothetical protein
VGDESRIFWQKSDPGSDVDDKTFIGTPGVALPAAPSRTRLPVRELFSKHYEKIREWCTSQSRTGVALVAMDGESVHGAAFLASKPGTVATAILGRHSQADLQLRGDASVSLRHLALLLYPDGGARPRYRLLDLRTATGFLDERGRRLRAIEVDGPAFVRLGAYTVLFFPVTTASPPWPEDAEQGWATIPDRLYLDEVETEEKSAEWEADSDRAWEVDELPRLQEPPTLVHSIRGPEMAVHELLDENDEVVGELRITSTRGLATIVVGRRAAEAGILLGRSRRCDAGRVLSDRGISRVHLLLIAIQGNLYAIDTASSNGVFGQEEEPERAVRLDVEQKLSLSDLATVEWRPSTSTND